jgi:hypothetical protein
VSSETKAVFDRLIAKHNDLGDLYPAYSLIAFSILANHAPEVLTFVLDQADRFPAS